MSDDGLIKEKPGITGQVRPLTPSEIESLLRDIRESSDWLGKELKLLSLPVTLVTVCSRIARFLNLSVLNVNSKARIL